MRKLVLIFMFLIAFTSLASAFEELKTVDYVDVERYLGKWYSVAELPQWFARRCTEVTAEYSMREDGGVDVLNSCQRRTIFGTYRTATTRARAYVVDEETNSKLEVRFFWGLVSGDYWIMELGENYEYAVVGNPARSSFWVLSRENTIDQDLLSEIIKRAENQGYDLSDLIYPWGK